jgi:hypothetical protein
VANLNKGTPIARTTPLKGLTVRQTNDGTVVAPNSVGLRSVDTDDGALRYGAKGLRVHRPVSGCTIIVTGFVSPMAAEALAARGVNVKTKALPGPASMKQSTGLRIHSEEN